ncbi:SURF1 family protein, partial [Pseudomonas aeruginosa]
LHLADAPAGGWPRLVTQLDIPALWQAFGRAGLPWEIRLEPGDASFDTDWPLVSMPPERHTGYAVQWFALATALLALYLYLGVRRAREKNHESRDSDA